MMYDEYVEKIKKISKVKNKIYKFRFLILSVLAVIIATVVTLLSIKGNTSELLLPEAITYGENYDASCSAVMSTITGYEHKLEGTDTWEPGLPDKPGEYYVRAVAERAFGAGYSEEKKISIAKRDLTLYLSNKTIKYGEYPTLSTTNLAAGDKITNTVFTFEDRTKSKTMIDITLADLDIINSNNESVTSCYNITYEKTEISFDKRDITLTPDGANKIYDGEALELPNTYKISQIPGYDDQITVSSYEVTDLNGNVMESVINPGKYNLKITSYDITSGGGSTLGNYNHSVITTPLTIEKRDIKINTASTEYTYDGETHKNDGFELAEGYTLGANDSLVLADNTTSILHYGNITNVMTVKVVDNDNNDVSEFYNISYNYGELKVNRRPITINIGSLEVTYDGENHSSDQYEQEGLVDGDTITSLSGVTEYKNAGEYTNSFTVNIENFSDYYAIYNYGTIKINKKDIHIKPVDKEVVYGNNINYSSSEYIDLNNELCPNDDPSSISIEVAYYQNGEKVTPHDTGLYEIKVDSYDSFNYNVISEESSNLSITKFNLSIQLKEMENVTYVGENHIYYDEIGNYIGISNLPYDDELKVLVKYNDSLDLPKDVNLYNVTYYDYEIINGLKDNYIIECNNSISFNILRKDIYITPIAFSAKIYDGIEYEYDIKDNNFVGIEYLCNDDKIKINVNYTIDGTPTDKVINAGQYEISVDNYEFTSGDENNYTVNLLTTEFKIFKRAITLKPNNIADKVYDGVEVLYSNRTPIVVEGNFVFDEMIEITSVSMLGENNDTVAINATTYHYNITGLEAVTGTLISNYDIEVVENTFTINPRNVKLNLVCDIPGYEKEYDGIYYYFGYMVNESTPLVDGEDLIPAIIYSGREYGYTSILNADTYDVSFGDVIAFNTLLSNYDIHKDDKEVFTVTPKHITITPINFEDKIYDGVSYIYESTENNFKEASSLISGDGITIDTEFIFGDSQLTMAKDAGSYTIRIIKYEFTSGISTNYIVDGVYEVSFEISKRNIKILLDKTYDNKEYDGIKYIYDYSVDNIVSGEVIEAEIAYKGINSNDTEILYVDTYDVYVDHIIDLDSNPYIKNYIIDTTDTHEFTVNKKPVVIRPIDKVFTYGDTISYDQNDYVFITGNLVPIDNNTAISISVDYYKNNIKVTPKNADTYEIRIIDHTSRNYDVTYDVSTLTINPYNLNITLKAMTEVTYDGNTHEYSSIYDNYNGTTSLPYGEKIRITVTYNDTYDLPKNAGTYIVKYDDYILQGESKDNYVVTCSNQITFIINPRPIKISPFTIDNKEYDGISVTYLSVFGAYSFVITDGTMVTGEEFTLDEIIITALNGDKLSSALDAGTYFVKIESLNNVIPGNSSTLKANYAITLLSTQFTINPRSIKFSLDSLIYEKTYDGLKYDSFTCTPYREDGLDALIGSESITADVIYQMQTPKSDTYIRNAGTYEVSMNVPNDTYYTNGAKEQNYSVDFTETKTFTVNKKALTLEYTHLIDNSKVYNGTPIPSTVYESISIIGLVTAYDVLNVSSLFNNNTTVPSDVGTYTITFDLANATVTEAASNPDYVTRIENYTITTNSIVYEIVKRDIRFYLVYSNLNRTYDGNIDYLTCEIDTQAPSLGLVAGESISPTINYQSRNYTADKTLRNVGTYDVSMTVSQANCGANTKLINYNVDCSDTKEYIITKKDLTVEYSYTSLTQLYKNKPIEIEVSITGNAASDTITANVTYNNSTAKPKDAGVYTVHITGYSISATNGTTRMENYNYTTPADVTYTVTKRTLVYNLTNTFGSNSMTYDGELHNNYYNVALGTCDGPAEGEETISASVIYSGQDFEDTYLRNKDIYDVGVKVDYKSFKSSNYETTLDTDTFEITAKPLNITFGADSSKIYDGLQIPEIAIKPSFSGLVDSDEITPTYSYNGQATNPKDVGTYAVKVSGLEIEIDSSKEELLDCVTRLDNYSISNVDEIIYTINQKKITITPFDYEFPYDGNTYTYKSKNNDYLFYTSVDDENPMPSGEEFRIEDVKLMLDGVKYDSVKNADKYYVYVDLADVTPKTSSTKKSNYDITITENVEFEILKRTIKYTLFAKDDDGNIIDSKEYDGKVQAFEFDVDSSCAGFVTGEYITPVIKYLGLTTGNDKILDIDTYKVYFDEDTSTYDCKDNTLLQNYNIDNSAIKSFIVNVNQITISLTDLQHKIYDGTAVVYDPSNYHASKNQELLDEYGFEVVVKYYADNVGATELAEIKNAGTYYIQIDETATRSIIDSIPELANNFVFAISPNYYEYTIEALMVKVSPTHYMEDNIDKFSDKIYDRLAYSGYDSTKYEATVDESQEGHSIPEGEGFIINVLIHEDGKSNYSDYIYANNVAKYIISINTVTTDANTLSSNYIITGGIYSFEITPVKVTITPSGMINGVPYYVDKEYDGNAYLAYDSSRDTANIEYEIDKSYFEGVTINPTMVLSDDSDELITTEIKDANNYYIDVIGHEIVGDNSSNYDISYEGYKFEITKRPVSIKLIPNTTSKVYDGLEFIYDGTYEVTSEKGFLFNSALYIALKGSRVNQGFIASEAKVIYAGTYNIEIDPDNSSLAGDVIGNYDITQTNKVEFIVEKRAVSIKTATSSLEYNGSAQYDASYEVTSELGMAIGDTLIPVTVTTATYVNTDKNGVKNEVSYQIKYADGHSSELNNDSYSIVVQYGRLTITKKKITLVSKTGTLIYDGTKQILAAFEDESGICDTDKVVFKDSTIKQNSGLTLVGSITNVLQKTDSKGTLVRYYTINNKYNNKDVTDNYDITYSSGTFTIAPREVTVIGYNSVSKEYTGKVPSISKSSIRYANGSLEIIAGDNPTITVDNAPIDVGIGTYQVGLTIKTHSNCYILNLPTTSEIEIEITPRKITLETASHSWEYDGLAHSDSTYTDLKRLITGHTLNAISSTSITNVGSVNNEIEFRIFDSSNNDITSNYNIIETYGILEIVEGIAINVKIADLEYSGELADITLDNATLFSPDGYDVSIYEIVSLTVNTVNGAINVGNDYTANIDYTYRNINSGVEFLKTNVDVTFNIVKRNINITVNTLDKVYTGERYKINGDDYQITSGSLLPGDILTIVGDNEGYYGTIRVGMKSYTVMNGSTDVTGNYNVEAKKGKISVDKISLSVSTGTGKFSYDLMPHEKVEYTIDTALLSQYGLHAEVANSASITNVGKISNKITFNILDSLNRTTFTDSDGYTCEYNKIFSFNNNYGDLIVNSVELIIEQADNNIHKVFSGEIIQSDSSILNVRIGDKSIADLVNLDVEFQSFYYPTFGDVDNNFVVNKVYDLSNNDITKNFSKITTNIGKINISTANISIRTLGNEGEYNGMPLTTSGVTINDIDMIRNGDKFELVYGLFTISLTDLSSITEIGQTHDVYTDLVILDSEGNDVTKYFTVNSSYGIIRVTQLT